MVPEGMRTRDWQALLAEILWTLREGSGMMGLGADLGQLVGEVVRLKRELKISTGRYWKLILFLC